MLCNYRFRLFCCWKTDVLVFRVPVSVPLFGPRRSSEGLLGIISSVSTIHSIGESSAYTRVPLVCVCRLVRRRFFATSRTPLTLASPKGPLSASLSLSLSLALRHCSNTPLFAASFATDGVNKWKNKMRFTYNNNSLKWYRPRGPGLSLCTYRPSPAQTKSLVLFHEQL